MPCCSHRVGVALAVACDNELADFFLLQHRIQVLFRPVSDFPANLDVGEAETRKRQRDTAHPKAFAHLAPYQHLASPLET
eukprot:CAMPEP_0170194446 /NCGR_PEP_ID=MMETSP0040_2-20121228/59302_1 /TAXON_ID=641309 /ORGANISM="Lotharella oceanica, Strain CCMP622" /LENGTH=79 /DNA_ID=CAMNT_0010443365 /DNA_START=608 /DNA_END=844 /DNA_ORIENTATION=+